jgi:hypothetical protein
VQQCAGLSAVLWHWTQNSPREQLVARQVVSALEQMDLAVFPSWETCWHFDDKIAQKYLLEALGAPLIPTWVFTQRGEAMEWIAIATWPKVFKLRCGAGSCNVRLVRSRAEAEGLCRRAFGRGFPAAHTRIEDVQRYVRGKRDSKDLVRRLWRLVRKALILALLGHGLPRQCGYVYFQEFLPNNAFDTRITIIGDRAFGYRRMNRPNDFRASGSGNPAYEPDRIDKRCVDIAFRVADRLATQSLAFDFLFNPQQEPMVGEISYCYVASMVHACEGYWDHQGDWHEGHVWPQDAVLEDILSDILIEQT